MFSFIKGAGIYGRFVGRDELPGFCQNQLEGKKIPDWEQKIFRFILDFIDPADHIIQESSGTTGTIKKYQIPKHAMIGSASGTIRFFKLQKGQSAMLCLPVDYIAGKMMIIRALVAGMNLYWTRPVSKPEIFDRKKIHFCAMVPLQVFNLLESGYSFSDIETLIIGGSEISSSLRSKLQPLSAKVYETFGMAETASHIALRRINGPEADPSFQTMPGVEVTMDDRNCLVIQASYLPEKVITNDMVEIKAEGKFFWKGRFDNLINSGGIKINPETIEAAIADAFKLETIAVGIPHEKLGQQLVLVSTRKLTGKETDVIRSRWRKVLPALPPPLNIIFCESVPRNETFKVDRISLTRKIAGLEDLKK